MTANTDKQVETIARDVLDFSKDDWVGLWVIFAWVKESFGTDDIKLLRSLTLAVVRQILSYGLKAGETPYSDNGFKEWPDQNVDAVVNRIERAWDSLGHAPDIGDIVAFG